VTDHWIRPPQASPLTGEERFRGIDASVRPPGQRVRAVTAQHPLPIRQRLLIQRDRAAQVPRRLVGAGEVVPRRQRVAMVAAAVCAGGTATHGVMALRLFDESVSATRTEPQR
jgi:hypothetical protein